MLRDDGATALKDMPVTLIVRRPDGSEFTRFAQMLPASGALYQEIALTKSSRRGQWSATAHIDPKAPPVGKVEFSVEDFVPEKLKVSLASDVPLLRAGKPNGFGIQADFLYGAPAGGLTVEADMRITIEGVPFANFANYWFGLEAGRKKFEPPLITLQAPDTDAAGKSRIEWSGAGVPDTALPLRVNVQARVFEPGNGRATKTEKALPLRTRDAYIGIRPTFEGRSSREGADSEFDIVAVDATGKQIAKPAVQYTIERIIYSYQWYQSDGRWRWQTNVEERVVEANTLALRADAPTRLAKRLSWGPHRLTIVDRDANTSSSMTFYVGYYGGNQGEEAPDTLKVASDKEKYAPGDTARLRIEAPFAGEALIAIATDRILATYPTKLPAGGTTVEVVKAETAPGAGHRLAAPSALPSAHRRGRRVRSGWRSIPPAYAAGAAGRARR